MNKIVSYDEFERKYEQYKKTDDQLRIQLLMSGFPLCAFWIMHPARTVSTTPIHRNRRT